MTDRPENSERLFQHLDDLIADIIDQFASEGHGTLKVIESYGTFWQNGGGRMIETRTRRKTS